MIINKYLNLEIMVPVGKTVGVWLSKYTSVAYYCRVKMFFVSQMVTFFFPIHTMYLLSSCSCEIGSIFTLGSIS